MLYIIMRCIKYTKRENQFYFEEYFRNIFRNIYKTIKNFHNRNFIIEIPLNVKSILHYIYKIIKKLFLKF